MADLKLKDVPFFQRPIGASDNDIMRGEDELGYIWYENPITGFRYSIQPNSDKRTVRGKASDLTKQTKKWFDKPSEEKKEDVKKIVKALPSIAKEIPGILKEDIDKLMAGEGSYGTLTEYALGTAAASTPFKVPKASLRTFGGTSSDKLTGGDQWGLQTDVDYDLEEGLLKAQDKAARGIDQRTVWEDTKWFQGKDGRWRFEIDDNKAKFFDTSPDLTAGSSSMRVSDYFDPFWYSSGLRSKELTPKEFWQGLRGQEAVFEGPLKHILDHPSLYEHYPFLEDMNVKLKPSRDAHIDWGKNEIVIGSHNTFEYMKGQLLHEVQHAIQYKEGFSLGGNTGMFSKHPLVKKQVHAWKENKVELDKIKKQLDSLKKDLITTSGADQTQLASAVKRLTSKGRELIDKGQNISDDIGRTQYNLYQSLYGEEEARAVAARLNLSAKEKAEMFPEDSYNLSRSYTGNTNPSYNADTGTPIKILRDEKPEFAEGGAVESSPRPRSRGPEATGEYTIYGRPVWLRDGQKYSEKTITVNYGDGWIVVPVVDDFGYDIPHDKIEGMIRDSGPYDFLTGEELLIFEDVEEANRYAQERSDNMFNPVWKFKPKEVNKIEPEDNNVKEESLLDKAIRGSKILGTAYLNIPRSE